MWARFCRWLERIEMPHSPAYYRLLREKIVLEERYWDRDMENATLEDELVELRKQLKAAELHIRWLTLVKEEEWEKVIETPLTPQRREAGLTPSAMKAQDRQ